MSALASYQARLSSFPAPGCGRHKALLGVANIGAIVGLSPEQIHADLSAATASAPLPDREIHAAILKAFREHLAGGTHQPPACISPSIPDGRTALQRIIAQGRFSDDADLWEASPYRLTDSVASDSIALLTTLFEPFEHVFIGDRLDPGIPGRSIRPVAEWITFFKAGGEAGPFVIINPLTGKPAPKKNGGESYRCDAAVAACRHCLVEFDTLSREDQIRFWSAVKLPILALIDSGGKSIHAWLDVQKLFNVTTAEQWHQKIKIGFYEKALVPLGVDRTCFNPARLSRLPSCFRAKREKFQRLLWLSPEGREVAR